jgi:hypothetical protein
MALLNKLQTGGSNLTNLNGTTPPTPNFKDSKVHNEYSINGSPNILRKPSPSELDLEGQVPKYNYRNNAPEGRTF